MASSIGFVGARTHLFSILRDVGDGCGGEESGVVKRERALFRNWPLVERRLAALGDNPGSVPWLLATSSRRLSCRLPRLSRCLYLVLMILIKPVKFRCADLSLRCISQQAWQRGDAEPSELLRRHVLPYSTSIESKYRICQTIILSFDDVHSLGQELCQ
jgi:hypothetical protein